MKLEFDIQVSQGECVLSAQAVLEGPVWGLLGPSGVGKTTLLNALMGLEKVDRGRIVLDGRVLLETDRRKGKVCVPTHRRRIGCVFQDNRLFPHLTVEGNLQYASRDAKKSMCSYQEIISLLDIGPYLGRRVTTLSGGEQRRVAIARALLASPELLLMDEPLTGVDAQRRKTILGYLRQMATSLSLPILIVSHDHDALLTVTDRIARMENGQIFTDEPDARWTRGHTLHGPSNGMAHDIPRVRTA